jgi:hypothetical protein
MLSKYQIKTIQDFMPPVCALLMKKNNLQCSVTATRVIYDVLTKLHFKVKPMAVEARVYNPLYTQKLRPPENDEEANKWLEEGCWSVILGDLVPKAANKWPGHLVAIINDVCIMDLTIVQAYRPDKNVIVNPVFAEINEAFIQGDIQRGVMNNDCLIVYQAVPYNQDWLKSRDWADKKAVENIEKDVLEEIRIRKNPGKHKQPRKDSPILREVKHLALQEGSYEEVVAFPPTETSIPFSAANTEGCWTV